MSRSLSSTDASDYITAAEMSDYGLTPEDVRRRYAWAVEYTALDGSPCWRREDFAEPLKQPE